MSDKTARSAPSSDPFDYASAMADIAGRSQALVQDFMNRQAEGGGLGHADPVNIGGAFLEMTRHMMSDPQKLVQAQFELWRDTMTLWQNATRRLMGQEVEPTVTPAHDDRRFRDAAWEENTLFDFIKQSYLLTARWMQNTVGEVEGLDDRTAKKVDFYTRQFVDAMAPSNFVMTNPEVLRETLESKGENLVRGLQNLLDDLERGQGRLKIKMSDDEAFEVGGNIAVSPGKVVFQNELMQLLQFDPLTDEVHKRPLLIVPPWINKYYILDLREKNSFIRWATLQGHTVFCVSWVNPDAGLAART
ncbi:MAG: class I poly(R)-hydroxyalkanoic acid synthase, partial [Alphaproteobacteria bacterium]